MTLKSISLQDIYIRLQFQYNILTNSRSKCWEYKILSLKHNLKMGACFNPLQA